MKTALLLLVLVSILAPDSRAATMTTIVNPDTRMVRIDFENLMPYEQIELQGIVESLHYCFCVDPKNPKSPGFSGSTVNAADLQIEYPEDGSAPEPNNRIEYHYLEGWEYAGLSAQPVEWVLVTLAGEGAGEEMLIGNKPLLLPVPEPSTALLGLAGLLALTLVRVGPERGYSLSFI